MTELNTFINEDIWNIGRSIRKLSFEIKLDLYYVKI